MSDLSQISDDELMKSAGLGDRSDQELMQIAGIKTKPERTENVLQRAAKAVSQIGQEFGNQAAQFGYGGLSEATFQAPEAIKAMTGFDMENQLGPGEPQNMMQNVARGAGRVGGFMVGGPFKVGKKITEKVVPFATPFAKNALEFGIGRSTLIPSKLSSGESSPMREALETGGEAFGAGTIAKFGPPIIKVASKVPGFLRKIPKRAGEIWNAPERAKEIGAQYSGIQSDIAGLESQNSIEMLPEIKRFKGKGPKILEKAQKNVLGEFESQAKELSTKSRNVFVEHVPQMKEKFGKLTKDTYSKYGEILKKGEEEALGKGMDAETYRDEVIQPVLDVIEKTGAKTPAAEKIKRLFTVKEGLGDKALEKADKAVLNNFDNLSSIEKMKALRTSLFKPGAEDFVQNMYSDLHGKFVGKFSPSVAKANESYGSMKAALRWGSKNIKPFNEQEVSRVADILEKNRVGGKGNETIQNYLNTLTKGKGEFKGSDLTKLSETHQKALDSIESEISANKSMIQKLESQHLEDVSTVKKGGYEDILQGRNVLQELASKKSQESSLKVLRDNVKRDLRIRDDLIRYGAITGLVSLGVGRGVYALSRAVHEPSQFPS